MIEKTKEEAINMSRYVDSEFIHERCIGCDKVFDYVASGNNEFGAGSVTGQKCRTYIRPAMWWEEMPVATRKELVKDKYNSQGVLMDVPVIDRVCPVATHVEVKKTVKGNKLNPIKASKRANKK